MKVIFIMEPIAIGSLVFGLAAAGAYGAGDFLGGFASKKSATSTVVFGSQVAGIVIYIVLAVVTRDQMPPLSALILGLISGVIGCIGVNVLYYALSVSRMSLVATVSALMAAIVPVVYTTLTVGTPDAVTLFGFVLALGAVYLISSGGSIGRVTARDLLLPAFAGTCFGVLFILISRATVDSTYIPLIAVRSSAIVVTTLLTLRARQPFFPAVDQMRVIIACGVLDAVGNIFFVLAAQAGRLDIASVLTALYPAGTVFLASFVLKERINRPQWLGVGLALMAIVCLSV